MVEGELGRDSLKGGRKDDGQKDDGLNDGPVEIIRP